MKTKLMKEDAIHLADEYCQRYMKSTLNYQFTKANYITGPNSFSSEGVWEITYDVENWDDVWYSVIVLDARREALCCSAAWTEVFYPHLKAT